MKRCLVLSLACPRKAQSFWKLWNVGTWRVRARSSGGSDLGGRVLACRSWLPFPSCFSLSVSPVVFQAVKQILAPRAAQAASRLLKSTCPLRETSVPLSHASRHWLPLCNYETQGRWLPVYSFLGNHRDSETVISFEVFIPQWCAAGRLPASPPVLVWLSLLSLPPAISQADLGSSPSSPCPLLVVPSLTRVCTGKWRFAPCLPSWPLLFSSHLQRL